MNIDLMDIEHRKELVGFLDIFFMTNFFYFILNSIYELRLFIKSTGTSLNYRVLIVAMCIMKRRGIVGF